MTPADFRARLDGMGVSEPGTSARQAALAFTAIMRHLGDTRPAITIQRQCEGWLHGDTATLPGWLGPLLLLIEHAPDDLRR